MNVTFGSGTAAQQQLCRAALGYLMNLNLARFPISLVVDFVSDPSVGIHNEFAYSGGADGAGTMRIKNDAPDFLSLDPNGQRWGPPFFNEVVAHELCHVLLGNMSAESQAEIAEMFGTTPEGWNPLDAAWEDRPLEGVCETFKDAFLPRRVRSYTNRTNHRIPISSYSSFRSKFRQALTLGAPPPPTEIAIPSFDADDLARLGGYNGINGSDPGFQFPPWELLTVDGGGGMYNVVQDGFPGAGGAGLSGFSIGSRFDFQAWLPEGTVVTMDVNVHDWPILDAFYIWVAGGNFPFGAIISESWLVLSPAWRVDGTPFTTDHFFPRDTPNQIDFEGDTDFGGPLQVVCYPNPLPPGQTAVASPGIIDTGKWVQGGGPTQLSITVDAAHASQSRVCRGVRYRLLSYAVGIEIFQNWIRPTDFNFETNEMVFGQPAEIDAALEALEGTFPHKALHVNACTPQGTIVQVPGETPPRGSVAHQGGRGGSLRSRDRVGGGRV